MGIFGFIKELFEVLFMGSSPEIQKKQQMKRLENELRSFQPVIFKNGLLQPNFAEAIRQLYIYTKYLDDIFSSTINTQDLRRNEYFMFGLIITGFYPEEQKELESLSYEDRKRKVKESDNASKEFENQRRIMFKLVERLNSKDFLRIDVVLADLFQLVDFCRFNFVSILTFFDRNFTGLDLNYHPDFIPSEVKPIERALEEMYSLCGNLKITTAVANAIFALLHLQTNSEISDKRKKEVLRHLQKIYYILTHILTSQVLKTLVAFAKENPNIEPVLASYKTSARQKFSVNFQEHFDADEIRIKQELEDETMTSELNELFGTNPMEHIYGYNSEINANLQNNSSLSFLWIRPLEIIKTFLTIYFTEPIKALLNDIVIEGFFNNQNYKTEFSSNVFSCLETDARIKAFEESFNTNAKYDVQKVNGYIRDSYKNSDFTKQLTSLINQINEEAKTLVVIETKSLFEIYMDIGELLLDARKAKNEIIDNLKVLMMSSRNRDSYDLLEKQYPYWKLFFELMKNYPIVNLKSSK